jgi:hypothetical protein
MPETQEVQDTKPANRKRSVKQLRPPPPLPPSSLP